MHKVVIVWRDSWNFFSCHFYLASIIRKIAKSIYYFLVWYMWVPMLVCIYSMYSLILWKFYKFQGRRKPLNCGCAVYLVNQYFSRQNLGLSKGSSQNVGVQLHTLHTRFRRPCNTCQNFYDPILKPVLKLLRYIN